MIKVDDIVQLKRGAGAYTGLRIGKTYKVREVNGSAVRVAGRTCTVGIQHLEKVEKNG